MSERKITEEMVRKYKYYLVSEEKSPVTIEKYIRDIKFFMLYAGQKNITKDIVIGYKAYLFESEYKPRSINSMIASINGLFEWRGWIDCKVKFLKIQAETYCPKEKELTKAEYRRLVNAAAGNKQLQLVIETICSTGIRVSELKYFTVETVKKGEITVNCKGKTRTILIPGKLKKLLLNYTKKTGISTGVIFMSRKRTPLNRSTIWAQMKNLCKKAGVFPEKVFPHNLRKLFARTFYSIEKDIAKLADILGHTSINTTRIYIMTTSAEHRRKIERLGLTI
ncbi:MAG: tyrosine-type recombinase/integrase [Oscillospiraceae bacterium]|nr:tyrosine-type recombinase/integrase [Oscillospiraceae bacterium]